MTNDKKIKKLLAGLELYISQNYTGEPRKSRLFAVSKCIMGKAVRKNDEDISEDVLCESVPFSLAPSPMPDLENALGNLGETFSQRLLRFIDESGSAPAEIYKKANIDRKLFSKIQCDTNYKPSKKTALMFALALELNLDDTKDLLQSAGLAFSNASVSDLIVEYFIKNEVWDILTVNNALYDHGQPVLE